MKSILNEIEASGLSRRRFLRNMFYTAGTVTAAQYITACGGSGSSPSSNSQANRGSGPVVTDPSFQSQFATMGPLMAADSNGIEMPAGFTSKILAEFNMPVLAGNTFVWHSDPDGGGTFRTDDGGWIYVSNSEARDGTTFGQSREQAAADFDNDVSFTPQDPTAGSLEDNMQLPTGATLDPLRGGVSALRFDANGTLIDAYPIERQTTTNCSGGATPWGTWINGEEIQDGYMFECSPMRDGGDAVRLDKFGRKGHEMVAIDPDGKAIYHTEDAGGNDRFYRNIFSDTAWPDPDAAGNIARPDMNDTTLQVLFVPAGKAAALNGPTPIVWNDITDVVTPQPEQYDDSVSTEFEGNEGVWYLDGFVFFSTKSDNSIWVIDVAANTIENIFNDDDMNNGAEPMTGVDNICMTLDGEMLVVEDGGFMRCMVLLPDRTVVPLFRLPGDPGLTEVTGIAIGPTGDKLYVSGQRSSTASPDTGTAPNGGGVTYEITMPFSVRVDRPLAGTLS